MSTSLTDFIDAVRDRLVSGGFIGRSGLESDRAALECRLSDREVLATSYMFFRLSGAIPQRR